MTAKKKMTKSPTTLQKTKFQQGCNGKKKRMRKGGFLFSPGALVLFQFS